MPRTAKSTKSAICGAFGTGDGEFVAGGAVRRGNRQIRQGFDDAGDTENGGFCFSIYIYCCEGRRTPLFVDAQPTNRSLLHRIPNHRNLMISEPFLTAKVQFTANTPKLFGKRQI